MSSTIRIASDTLTTEIDPLGAQLSLLRDAAGNDLLWNGDPAFWTGRAPVLFPIVGALAGGHFRLGSERYALPRHGFARGLPFEVVEATAQRARFRLVETPATRAVYPFRFVLELTFDIAGARLSITATVHNPADTPLPASVGFHPALRWPLPGGGDRAAHQLTFEVDEPSPIRRLDAAGLLRPDALPTPVEGRTLMLGDELFRDDVVIFDRLRSRSLRYGSGQGATVKLGFPDASHLGLWTKPGAGFLCIEPWRGLADPAGFAGPLAEKPGVFLVSPGGSESLRMTLEIEPD